MAQLIITTIAIVLVAIVASVAGIYMLSSADEAQKNVSAGRLFNTAGQLVASVNQARFDDLTDLAGDGRRLDIVNDELGLFAGDMLGFDVDSNLIAGQEHGDSRYHEGWYYTTPDAGAPGYVATVIAVSAGTGMLDLDFDEAQWNVCVEAREARGFTGNPVTCNAAANDDPCCLCDQHYTEAQLLAGTASHPSCVRPD